MNYNDDYSEAAYLERMYEQHKRDSYRELLETTTTPEEDAKALPEAQEMAEAATAAVQQGTYSSVCVYGEAVFYYAYPKGLVPGHIYSEVGMDEFKISRCCEYHFDDMFKDDEDE